MPRQALLEPFGSLFHPFVMFLKQLMTAKQEETTSYGVDRSYQAPATVALRAPRRESTMFTIRFLFRKNKNIF